MIKIDLAILLALLVSIYLSHSKRYRPKSIFYNFHSWSNISVDFVSHTITNGKLWFLVIISYLFVNFLFQLTCTRKNCSGWELLESSFDLIFRVWLSDLVYKWRHYVFELLFCFWELECSVHSWFCKWRLPFQLERSGHVC